MNRIDSAKTVPEINRALVALEQQVRKSSLGDPLVNLVYLRVSQLNGCAFCIDMHSHDLARGGETPQRLALLAVWREVPSVFSPRERVALAWAEEVTKLGPHGVSDAVYGEAKAELGEKGLVELTLAVSMINVWNRFGVPFQKQPPNRAAETK